MNPCDEYEKQQAILLAMEQTQHELTVSIPKKRKRVEELRMLCDESMKGKP